MDKLSEEATLDELRGERIKLRRRVAYLEQHLREAVERVSDQDDEITTLEQRLEAAEANTQRAIDAINAQTEVAITATRKCIELQAKLDAANAEIAELRNNAERYRWLRDCDMYRSDRNIHVTHTQYLNGRYSGQTFPSGEELDAVIDASMQERKP